MTGEELEALAYKYAKELSEKLNLSNEEIDSLMQDVYVNGFMQGATLIVHARITKEFQ